MAILAAIGEEHESSEVVATAYDLARAFGETLYVMHVFPKQGFETHQEIMEEYTFLRGLDITQEIETARKFAAAVVENTLGEYDEDLVEPIGDVGSPTQEVLQAVDEMGARYLVVGGRRRSPIGKAIFGDRTQKILLESEVPVLTVMIDD